MVRAEGENWGNYLQICKRDSSFGQKQKLCGLERTWMWVKKKQNPSVKKMMKKYHWTAKKKRKEKQGWGQGVIWWRFLLSPAQVKTGPGLGLVNTGTAGTPAVTRLSTGVILFQKSIGMN